MGNCGRVTRLDSEGCGGVLDVSQRWPCVGIAGREQVVGISLKLVGETSSTFEDKTLYNLP